MRSRSATQRATWSRVFGLTAGQYSQHVRPAGVDHFLRSTARCSCSLFILRAALDAHALGLVVELLLRPALRPASSRSD